MHDDIFQMYLEEIEGIKVCTPEEEAALLPALLAGDEAAKSRLLEGNLKTIADLVQPFAGQELPLGDLIQEANVALILLLNEYQGGDFRSQLKAQVESAVRSALDEQKAADQTGEEMLARVNVLKDISARMAEELGREATVEELASKMKMTEDEIKSIMKLTLDAMSVSPDAEV